VTHIFDEQTNIDGIEPVAGRIPVDGSGVTQPVSIATMPTTPVTGTFWQVTQPVSISQTTPGTTNAVTVKLIDETGAVYGVKHINNKPRVSSMPYLYDIAEGNVTGHTAYAKLGYNAAVGATEEDIITQGGVYPWLASATALEVVSSNANDTVAGSGVQKVRISYLDGDYSSQSEIVSLNGTTSVPLTDTTVLRVNAIRATQVGAGLMAAGNITCRLVAAPNTVYRQIETGFTRGRGLTYTVPLGKTLYITSISVSSAAAEAGKAVVRWIGRAQVDDNDPTTKINFFQPFFEKLTLDNSFYREFEIPVRIPATADLKLSATSSVVSSACNCELRGWLE
jgi:hypothetical protein